MTTNGWKFATLATAALLAISPAGAKAAALLTSDSTYTGPTLNFRTALNSVLETVGFPYEGGEVVISGSVRLPGGITITAESNHSIIGGGYGFDGNGTDQVIPMAATNDPSSFITLTFDTPVAMFGGPMNYADPREEQEVIPRSSLDGEFAIIRAFDVSNNLIASYDLVTDAEIRTSGDDQFRFRGIDGQGQLIKSFQIGGSFIGVAGSLLPEPSTWALLIGGFSAAGVMLRRRRTVLAAG